MSVFQKADGFREDTLVYTEGPRSLKQKVPVRTEGAVALSEERPSATKTEVIPDESHLAVASLADDLFLWPERVPTDRTDSRKDEIDDVVQ